MVTKSAIPATPEQLEEALTDAVTRREELLADPAQFKAFVAKYTRLALQHDPGLREQMEVQQRAVLGRLLQEHGIDPKAPVGKVPLGSVDGKGKAPSQWKSFGEFLQASHWKQVMAGSRDSRLQKDLNVSQGDQGGFLVPDEFRAELLRLSLENAVVRPRARVIPMARETLLLPMLRDTTHLSTVYGGVTAQWVREGGSVSSATNEPTFGQVRLDAKKLTGYTVVSNELMASSAIALESFLLGLYAEAIAYFEDDAFIQGSGAGQPVGLLNADALISVAKETGQAATTIVWENIVKMFSRMLPQSLSRAVWIAHQDTIPQLATLSLAVGTGGSAMWLTSGQNGLPTALLGRPIVYTEKCKTLGTAGDIYFADLSQYLIGDRQSLSVASSPHVNFTTDETVWRFIHRVDGRPWLDSALTPRNGNNTVSPFVALATRA